MTVEFLKLAKSHPVVEAAVKEERPVQLELYSLRTRRLTKSEKAFAEDRKIFLQHFKEEHQKHKAPSQVVTESRPELPREPLRSNKPETVSVQKVLQAALVPEVAEKTAESVAEQVKETAAQDHQEIVVATPEPTITQQEVTYKSDNNSEYTSLPDPQLLKGLQTSAEPRIESPSIPAEPHDVTPVNVGWTKVKPKDSPPSVEAPPAEQETAATPAPSRQSSFTLRTTSEKTRLRRLLQDPMSLEADGFIRFAHNKTIDTSPFKYHFEDAVNIIDLERDKNYYQDVFFEKGTFAVMVSHSRTH